MKMSMATSSPKPTLKCVHVHKQWLLLILCLTIRGTNGFECYGGRRNIRTGSCPTQCQHSTDGSFLVKKVDCLSTSLVQHVLSPHPGLGLSVTEVTYKDIVLPSVMTKVTCPIIGVRWRRPDKGGTYVMKLTPIVNAGDSIQPPVCYHIIALGLHEVQVAHNKKYITVEIIEDMERNFWVTVFQRPPEDTSEVTLSDSMLVSVPNEIPETDDVKCWKPYIAIYEDFCKATVTFTFNLAPFEILPVHWYSVALTERQYEIYSAIYRPNEDELHLGKGKWTFYDIEPGEYRANIKIVFYEEDECESLCLLSVSLPFLFSEGADTCYDDVMTTLATSEQTIINITYNETGGGIKYDMAALHEYETSNMAAIIPGCLAGALMIIILILIVIVLKRRCGGAAVPHGITKDSEDHGITTQPHDEIQINDGSTGPSRKKVFIIYSQDVHISSHSAQEDIVKAFAMYLLKISWDDLRIGTLYPPNPSYQSSALWAESQITEAEVVLIINSFGAIQKTYQIIDYEVNPDLQDDFGHQGDLFHVAMSHIINMNNEAPNSKFILVTFPHTILNEDRGNIDFISRHVKSCQDNYHMMKDINALLLHIHGNDRFNNGKGYSTMEHEQRIEITNAEKVLKEAIQYALLNYKLLKEIESKPGFALKGVCEMKMGVDTEDEGLYLTHDTSIESDDIKWGVDELRSHPRNPLRRQQCFDKPLIRDIRAGHTSVDSGTSVTSSPDINFRLNEFPVYFDSGYSSQHLPSNSDMPYIKRWVDNQENCKEEHHLLKATLPEGYLGGFEGITERYPSGIFDTPTSSVFRLNEDLDDRDLEMEIALFNAVEEM